MNGVMYPQRSTSIFPRLSNKLFTASARNKMLAAGLLLEPALPRIMITSSVRLALCTIMWMAQSQHMNPVVTRMAKIIRMLSLEEKNLTQT